MGINQRRSKACRTCRDRHVRCDECRPICKRCENGGFQCRGYPIPSLFIDERERAARPTGSRRRSNKNSTLAFVDSISPLYGAKPYGDSAPTTLVPSTSGTFLDNVQMSFIMRHLVNGMAELHTPLQPLLIDRLIKHDPAATALKQYYFGRISNHPDSITSGLSHYHKALKSLARDLDDPQKAISSTDILVTANLLAMFESVAGTSVFAFLKHTRGIAHLVQLRPPLQHQTELERAVLELSRFEICLNDMLVPRHCFLAQLEWKVGPWLTNVTPKTFFSRLIDIFADLPGLAADVNDVDERRKEGTHDDFETTVLLKSVTLRARYMFMGLFLWRLEWETTYPGVCYDVILTPRDRGYSPSFPAAVYYSSFSRCVEILFYDILLLTLTRGCVVLMGRDATSVMYNSVFTSTSTPPAYTALNPHSITNPSLYHPLVPSPPTPRHLATEIARSLAYLILPEHSAYKVYYVVFAIRVVRLYFLAPHHYGDHPPSSPAEEEWSRQVVEVWAEWISEELSVGCGFKWTDYGGLFQEEPGF